jgi:hypothetical protein
MLYLAAKAALSGLIIAVVSEVAHRSPTLVPHRCCRWFRSSAFVAVA